MGVPRRTEKGMIWFSSDAGNEVLPLFGEKIVEFLRKGSSSVIFCLVIVVAGCNFFYAQELIGCSFI